MKKLFSLSVVTLGLSFANIASAANYPVLLVNNSKLQLTVNYSICDAEGKFCSLATRNLNPLGSGNNSVVIVGKPDSASEKLLVTEAIATDNEGKQVASLHQQCNLPSDLNTIILNDNGTSSITCQYGQS